MSSSSLHLIRVSETSSRIFDISFFDSTLIAWSSRQPTSFMRSLAWCTK